MSLKLSYLADQLGGGTGGGRFTTEFLRTLLGDPDLLDRIELLDILRTQDEPIELLGFLPSNVRIVNRRFPSRLRTSAIAQAMALTCSPCAVAHGPFFYVFPRQGRSSLVTAHDVSFLVNGFHPPAERQTKTAQYSAVFSRCHAIVCSSDATAREVLNAWPALRGRVHRIYCGAGPLTLAAPRGAFEPPPSLSIKRLYILAVGTIEPRKNYDRLLDSFEYLLSQLGESAPDMVIIGSEGWMCQSTVQRLRELQQAGKLHWLNSASDDELSAWYEQASLFTYLSLYEGFGYPPFEAAHAGIPMVLSNQSSVGEIWRDHARCVDPTNVGDIVDAWRWALNLDKGEQAAVVERQAKRAAEFSWQRCVESYLDLYEQLAHNDR